MFGNDEARRTYIRLDSGELGPAHEQLTALDRDRKMERRGRSGAADVQPEGGTAMGGASMTGYYNYSDRAEIDYQDLSLDIIARRGWEWDNWYPGLARGGRCGAGVQRDRSGDTVVCDDAYWNASGLREDDLAYLRLDLPFGKHSPGPRLPTRTRTRARDCGAHPTCRPLAAHPFRSARPNTKSIARAR